MNIVSRLFQSTLGKKYIMAITGFLLFGFVAVHLLGNLQLFSGPEAINRYAELLRAEPALLWVARIGLLGITVLHIVTAIQLVLRNRAARPQKYVGGKDPVGASVASRTAAISGTIILAFIIFHLLHYTLGIINPDYLNFHDAQGRHDVYRMVVHGFSNPLIAGFYLLSMALLCMHLSHGLSAMFQSLGLRNGAYDKFIDRLAKVAAAVILVGNCALVLSVLFGAVR